MGFTQTFMGCGPFQVRLRPDTPRNLLDQIIDGAGLVVFRSKTTQPFDDFPGSYLNNARFHGIITDRNQNTIAGSELSWLLGKPGSDDGPKYTYVSDLGSSVFDIVAGAVNGTDIRASGTISTDTGLFPIGGPATVGGPPRVAEIQVRERLDMWVDYISQVKNFPGGTIRYPDGMAWHIDNFMRISFHEPDQIFRSEQAMLADGEVRGGYGGTVWGPSDVRVDTDRSLRDYATIVTGYGDRLAGGTTEIITLGLLGSINGPNGFNLKTNRNIDMTGADYTEDTISRIRDSLDMAQVLARVTSAAEDVTPYVTPGDTVYVHKQREFVDYTYQVIHQGRPTNPKVMQIKQIRHPILATDSVWVRNPPPTELATSAGWIDLTDWIVPETSRVEYELHQDLLTLRQRIGEQGQRLGFSRVYAERVARA